MFNRSIEEGLLDVLRGANPFLAILPGNAIIRESESREARRVMDLEHPAPTVVPILPYLLAFAAGAMMYVVVEELIPEMSEGEHSNAGTIAFALGFVLMMILDVALG